MGPKFSKSSTDSEEDQQYYGKSVFGALPIHFIHHSLDDDLLLFLQSDPFFLTPEDKLESIGYSKAIDYPELTNHFYYEGYFHSRPSPAPFHSMNARYGYDFDKPSGPLRLTAFLETLRRVNASWTDHMISELSKLCTSDTPSNMAASSIRNLLMDNRHFGDLSSQIHFGDEVPPERANFHNDGPNSALHVALSIRGHRSLFWKGSKDVAFRNEVNVYSANPSGYCTHEAKQRPGSVYLSSPFIVSHGVGYTQSSWDERIIAVQCRCLFTREEFNNMKQASEHDWITTMETVSACLGKKKKNDGNNNTAGSGCYVFRLPTLAEVQQVFEELLPQWEEEEAEAKKLDASSESASTATKSTSTTVSMSLVQFMKSNPHEGISDT